MEQSATVDVEVMSRPYVLHCLSFKFQQFTVVEGSQFINSHTIIGKLRTPTYFVELKLDDVKEQTSGAQNAENGRFNWEERFILYVRNGSVLQILTSI